MGYKASLGGDVFDLEDIFVENSLVIKGLIEVCQNEGVIPLMYEDMDRELLEDSVKLLRALVEGGRKWVKFKEEFMVMENEGKIVRLLNMVNFYDMRVLEEYLVDSFAERVRRCNGEDDLRHLFNGKISDYKYVIID